MARCAFSGREIDLAYPGWLRTPDGKVVLPQFYETYVKNLAKKAKAPAPKAEGKSEPKSGAIAPKTGARGGRPKKEEGKALGVRVGDTFDLEDKKVETNQEPPASDEVK